MTLDHSRNGEPIQSDRSELAQFFAQIGIGKISSLCRFEVLITNQGF